MDKCPCGALVVVDSVAPDFTGWTAHCEAGHPLFLPDLVSVPVLVDTVKTEYV